jgi:hypothetical protein
MREKRKKNHGSKKRYQTKKKGNSVPANKENKRGESGSEKCQHLTHVFFL